MEEDGPEGEPGEMRTELGVMGAPESGNSSPHSMQNYSLDDLEQPAPPPPPVSAAQSAPKATAAAAPAELAAAEQQAAPSAGRDDGLESIDLASEAEDVKMMKGVERSA